jgi:hypothetical protein
MRDIRETLADVYAERYHGLLEHVAKMMLHDWREAVKIAEEASSRLEARRAEIEARAARYESREDHRGVLHGAISGTFTRVAVERKRALGYIPPECEEGIRAALEILEMSEEWAAGQRAERAELAERIETLPAVLREPCRLWLNDEEIPESLGWYVRQALTLLGRRRVAA